MKERGGVVSAIFYAFSAHVPFSYGDLIFSLTESHLLSVCIFSEMLCLVRIFKLNRENTSWHKNVLELYLYPSVTYM